VSKADGDVLAVCCSDIHLSHRPPLFRSAEPDWYAAMARTLDELSLFGTMYNCPIVVAGDIFDKWNPPPELINFAIKHLPKCFAVPGQHDLPNHNYDERTRSAYWTLVEAGVVENLHPGSAYPNDQLVLHGFPWGFDITPPMEKAHSLSINLAVIHRYVWSRKLNTGYPGAPEEALGNRMISKLKGYDAAIFGDNHRGFEISQGIMNCGALIRRKSDEADYVPCVSLLKVAAKGEIDIQRVPLASAKQDVFLKPGDAVAKMVKDHPEVETFVAELMSLGDSTMDFREALERFFRGNSVVDGVRKIILECLEGK
jgi:DNA repair exonuclease SbcCD nuclease subunit